MIFIGISFLINQNNAKDLLSGYNTMSDVEKQNFDIATYVLYFKKFNLFLGFSLFSFSIFIIVSSKFRLEWNFYGNISNNLLHIFYMEKQSILLTKN